MRLALLLAALLIATSASAQAPVIIEGTPVVNQGATLQFHETLSEAGTWAMSGAHSGSITSGGLYSAPVTVTPCQTIGGYQLFPCNSVFNQRVDGLPLRSDSATLMAGTGTANLITREIYSFPMNYCDGSTPLKALLFNGTPSNNGNFQMVAYPGIKLESGWFNTWDGNRDHHYICVDGPSGTVQEVYQPYPFMTSTTAQLTGSVVTINFASSPIAAGLLAGAQIYNSGYSGNFTALNGGPFTLTASTTSSISFALTHADITLASATGSIGMDPANTAANAGSGLRYLNSTYALPVNGSTDAAGLPLAPLTLRIQEVEQAIATSGTIKHALRFTLGNNLICQSSTANACYSGQPGGIRHIWPATAEAFNGTGLNPYGMVYRLKAAYNCSTFSSIAQIFCNQMKQYGLMLADGGTDWSIIGEAGKWPLNIVAALQEIENANIEGATNFEIPDLLSIQATASQTCPTPSNCSLSSVTPERVCFTRTSDSAVACVDVALMGVAVNLPHDSIDIQSGTAAQQLTAFVHGGAANTVAWSVSPAITGGSLTSGGLLTPPATIASVTSYTVTATSTDNAAIAATMNLNLYPTGSIFIRPGAPSLTPFTDSNGNVWATSGGDGQPIGPFGDLSGGSWGALANKQIYYYRGRPANDDHFDFTVPLGSYSVTIKLATDQASPGGNGVGLGIGSSIVYPYEDVNTAAGGNYKPADFVMSTTVSNGLLPIRVWAPYVSGSVPIINAIQIDYTGPLPSNTPVAPSKLGTLMMAGKRP